MSKFCIESGDWSPHDYNQDVCFYTVNGREGRYLSVMVIRHNDIKNGKKYELSYREVCDTFNGNVELHDRFPLTNIFESVSGIPFEMQTRDNGWSAGLFSKEEASHGVIMMIAAGKAYLVPELENLYEKVMLENLDKFKEAQIRAQDNNSGRRNFFPRLVAM